MKAFWNVLFWLVVAMILLADLSSTTLHLLRVCEDCHIIIISTGKVCSIYSNFLCCLHLKSLSLSYTADGLVIVYQIVSQYKGLVEAQVQRSYIKERHIDTHWSDPCLYRLSI